MAYIPPHKRHSDGSENSSPVPSSLLPQPKKRSEYPSYRPNNKAGKIVYASQSVSRWCAVGVSDDNDFPSVHLQPISLESVERRTGDKPLILVNPRISKENSNEVKGNLSGSPWEAIVENVQQDLLSSFGVIRKEMETQEMENVKPNLVARFGKILFQRTPKFSLDEVMKSPAPESTLRQLKRSYCTSLPASYMENIVTDVVPKIGLDFVGQKDAYLVRLSDSAQPGITMSCKCIVDEDKRLKLCKVDLSPVRCLVVDVSCLDKDIDLRLMLCTKKTITSSLPDVEMAEIRNLLSFAIIDEKVKGGVRWPMGKSVSGDRYEVIAVWHTVATSYTSQSLRLKVRNADRFDFIHSSGESSREMTLIMKSLSSKLKEEIDDDSASGMLKDTIKLIWENFLRFKEPFFT
ncbi:hypothetical protein ACFE04_024166 [Oxalis oulophora]